MLIAGINRFPHMNINIPFGNESAKKAQYLFKKVRTLKPDVTTTVTTQQLVEII